MELETYNLEPANGLPNSRFPLIVYRAALENDACSPDGCAALFRRNGWQGLWLNGVFSYWHYHAQSHEVLGCVAASAHIGFGGDHGVSTDFNAGDVVLIPAGVGHKRLSQQPGFLVIGGYPPGQDGAITDAGKVDMEVAIALAGAVPAPQTDPVLGVSGGLHDVW